MKLTKRHGFSLKMALTNIRNNQMLYLPRILAEAGLLACYYIMITITMDGRLAQALGGSYLQTFMSFGAFVLGVLSLILILYVNSFLMKRRKSEYGLYNVLGMEKRHIVRVLFMESFTTSLISILAGLVLGALFYKAASLLICRLFLVEVVAGFYYLSVATFRRSAVLFLGMDLFAFLVNALSILRMKPVELLAGKHTGEKEPKVKWFLLILGVLSLGAGYFIAVTVQSPLQAILLFFGAVILVIIGTYCLFVTGTTFVLKCLQKNKKYYYNRRHMPAVSGLLYRMKQNAVGLASIAILATGVLVMMSTTVSLYSGVEDSVNNNYPQHLYLSAFQVDGENMIPASFESLTEVVQEVAEEKQVVIEEVLNTNMLIASYVRRGDSLLTKAEVTDGYDIYELSAVVYITQDTYRDLKKTTYYTTDEDIVDLEPDEIGFCQIMSTVRNLGEAPETLTIGGKVYRVKNTISYFPISFSYANVVDACGIVVSDETVLEEIYRAQKEAYGEYASEYAARIGVNFTDEAAVSAIGEEFDQAVRARMMEKYPGALTMNLDTKWDSRHNTIEMYSTFLFLGILLGFVCLFSTILIIYYKQVSEGYEDRERFQIMQKIGMEAREVRKTIGSQLVLQFFLPLITAAIHMAFAFPILLKLLQVLMLSNTMLFVICTLITLAVFALVYTVVYLLTAGTYYKIVH